MLTIFMLFYTNVKFKSRGISFYYKLGSKTNMYDTYSQNSLHNFINHPKSVKKKSKLLSAILYTYVS